MHSSTWCERSSSACLLERWICIEVCRDFWFVFFFQAEDGIRDLVRSRGLGDVYKRQLCAVLLIWGLPRFGRTTWAEVWQVVGTVTVTNGPVSYTHLDAADERSSVDLGGRRIIKKKKNHTLDRWLMVDIKQLYIRSRADHHQSHEFKKYYRE